MCYDAELCRKFITYHALLFRGNPVAFRQYAKLNVVSASHLDIAGQHFDGLVCEFAATQVQLCDGLIAAQAVTKCLHKHVGYIIAHTAVCHIRESTGSIQWLCGSMVEHPTPDRKVACSIHVVVKCF